MLGCQLQGAYSLPLLVAYLKYSWLSTCVSEGSWVQCILEQGAEEDTWPPEGRGNGEVEKTT